MRAGSDLRLHALGSDHFLPVVIGYTPSAREAGAVVDTMLDRFTPRDSVEHVSGEAAGESSESRTGQPDEPGPL